MNLRKINEAKNKLRQKSKINAATVPIGNNGLSIQVTESYQKKAPETPKKQSKHFLRSRKPKPKVRKSPHHSSKKSSLRNKKGGGGSTMSFTNPPVQRKSLLIPSIPSLLNKSQIQAIAKGLNMSYMRQKTNESIDSTKLLPTGMVHTPKSRRSRSSISEK